MAINAKKTSLMCVSAASSFQAKVRVNVQGQAVCGADSLKILGVTLDSQVSFATHTENIARKLRAKTWTLGRLKKIGHDETKLLRVYKCLIRPTAEYAAPAWHSLLTAGQAALLERQQSAALRHIYGQGISAAKMRAKGNIDLLSTRRETLVKKFANKSLTNPRCKHWFNRRVTPSYTRRSSVSYPIYRENFARTDRHRNSPMNYLVRKLNEQ